MDNDEKKFLFSKINEDLEKSKIEIPASILEGIKEKYVLREYQEKALKNFICYMNNKNSYQSKNQQNDLLNSNKNHLLFNVATGGGKTLLMACIILYMHKEYGYNNVLFLSHLTSINTKTIENFFNKNSSKYLFSDKINVKNVDSFLFEDVGDINISISTYQSLSTLLNIPRENAFSLEDIKNKKILIIADEAHHLNAGYGNDKDYGVWENGVERVLSANNENFLLEFTATIDWKHPILFEKYYNKCIYRYDLKNFYESGYTKYIDLIQRDVDNKNLMYGAIILSKYREILFNELNVNVKPVILFKSKTIKESQENHKKFIELIEELNEEVLNNFYEDLKYNANEITRVALEYLKEKLVNLIDILKIDFSKINIIDTNNTDEIDNNAVLLNTLENKENHIRVIFSVDKLNEGWDVLNLFDIVKLYKTQSTTETTREAQLIGRGARYCPFYLENKEYYKRKFDPFDKYSILEQLFFHSSQDNMAIAKLKKELENMGIKIEENKEIVIELKQKFTNPLIANKKIFINKRIKKRLTSEDYNIYEDIREKFHQKDDDSLNSGIEKIFHLMNQEDLENKVYNEEDKVMIKMQDIDYSIKWNAIINNIDYNFTKLGKKLSLKSFDDFIKRIDFIEIKVKNWKGTNQDKYSIYSKLLKAIYDKVISKEIRKYEGTKSFDETAFSSIFHKSIRKKLSNEEVLCNEDFIMHNKGDFTSEEKAFVEFFKLKIYDKLLKGGYSSILLLRNEKELKLYQFNNGVGFEPDFILFLNKNNIYYQVYIEPKGNHLFLYDDDKNKFLQQITELTLKGKLELNIKTNKKFRQEDSIIKYEEKSYKLIGLQFYNENIERKEGKMEREIEKYFLNND